MDSFAKLALYIIKNFDVEVLNRAKDQDPDPCYVCNNSIIHISEGKLVSITTFPCSHTHHTICTYSLEDGSCCPFPSCKEIIRTSNYSEDDESSGDNTILPSPKGQTLKAKAFKKQLESRGPDLKLLSVEEDKEMDWTTDSGNTDYSVLNKKIEQAETRSENKDRELISSKQDVIIFYYQFGEVMNARFEELKEIHPVKSSRNILNREIRKKLNGVSPNVIKKRIRTARIIFDIFSTVGVEKICLITFTASSIGTFTDDEINYIKEKNEDDLSDISSSY